MSQLLIEHAKRHVWQEPDQDFQFNIGLGRLTKNGGFLKTLTLGWHQVLSPTRHDGSRLYHHVYQIGQISDITLNLVKQLEEDKWYPAEGIVNKHNVLIQVYMLTGAMIPLSHVWLMRDFTMNLLVCVWHDRQIDYGYAEGYIDPVTLNPSPYRITLDNTRLAIRFYSNSAQTHIPWNDTSGTPTDTVEVCSAYVTNQREYNRLITQLTNIRRKYLVPNTQSHRGRIMSYVDGFLKMHLPAFGDAVANKRLSFIYDESIMYTQDFKLKHLPVFKSKLDLNQNKYLILLNQKYETIIHWDDVDFYLVNHRLDQGVFLSRTHPDYIRQVVHNAFSLDAEMVQTYVRLYDWMDDIDELSIHVIVRRGGMQDMPFSQANRIDELFRLPYLNIVNVFLNTDSRLDEWRASELENSMYMKLVSSKGYLIDEKMVTEAYGYPGIVQSLLSPILEKEPKSDKWNIPEGITWSNPSGATVYRTGFYYDANGLYLGHYAEASTHHQTSIPKTGHPKRLEAANLEMFRLRLSTISDNTGTWVNDDIATTELDDYGYACYIAADGTSDWMDVTGKPFYKYIPAKENSGVPKIAWDWKMLTAANATPCVRVNSRMLVYRKTVNRTGYNGYYSVVVQGTHRRGKNSVTGNFNFPVGKVDVFANGYCMIPGIDYYMDFPTIVINNQQINQMNSVDIVVRCYGLADPETCDPFPPAEIGFVRGGWLSADGQYSIARNRPNFVVSNARRQWNHRTGTYAAWMEYYENTTTNAGHRADDGRPYMVQDYIVPIDHLCPATTTDLYTKMVDTDRRLGNYLTQLIPEHEVILPRAITNRWQLVSPIISSMLHAIKNGWLQDANLLADFTVADVENWMRSYKWLLPYDPAHHNLDESYTYILPHPYFETMSCSLKQYQFLEMVNTMYLNGRVDLTKHVEVR